METKRCTKCGEEKELREFGKHSSSKDGLNYWCRCCYSSYTKQRWKSHPDVMKRQQRESNTRNKEKRNYRHRVWLEKNRDYTIQYGRNYYQKNRDNPYFRFLKRKYSASYKRQHPERIIENRKKQTDKEVKELKSYYIIGLLHNQHGIDRDVLKNNKGIIELKKLEIACKRALRTNKN